MAADRFDLVIFDCDGVLVDSERIAVQVDARIFADLGCEFTEAEIVDLLVGSSTEVWRATVQERLGRPLEHGWEEPYHSWYREALDAGLTAVDGIAEALDALTLPSCVASNGGHGGMRRNLALVGLFERFEGRIFSAEDVTRGKPEPDLFLHAARVMGVDPARCAVVEDSAYGVRAAQAAGMAAFGYAGGLTAAARLAGPGTVVFDDMRRLPALLAGTG
ncbi:HAD family hydrolase [Kitasatospora sp. NPDC057015]|uniref:HAD family hydrolase n=1 Tax=Kitasatospora sp. NPDC057015 TaxID=3346001 RepID=UPI0036326D34